MRIALMTWFEYENYGTVLQASALYHVLESNFGKTDIINYRVRKPHWVKPINYKEVIVRKLRQREQLKPYSSNKRSWLFEQYIKEKITVTNRVNSFPELAALNDEYDVFVCGSDQIWTPNSGDMNYYLPFVNKPQRRVAYAPSFGMTKIQDSKLKGLIAKELLAFDSLSSREIQGAELVERISGKKSTLVLDPTLLLTKEEWIDYLNIGSIKNEFSTNQYILCYFLGDYRRYSESINKLARKLGVPVKVIPIWEDQGRGNIEYEVGPREFVELFLNARYVFTDSFHGVAFSVNFNIPFSVFKRFSDKDPKSQNSRITSFLELTDLSERITNPGELIDEQCDFLESNRKIDSMRESSYRYLRNALGSAELLRVGVRDKKKKTKPIVLADYCSGCGACAAVCSKGAISIEINCNGFRSYSINEEKCVRCGKCVSICPMISVRSPYISEAQGLYSFKSKDPEILSVSSSGGIGAVLSQVLLNQEKKVFGCKYDTETNRAVHVEVDANSLKTIQGSKYLQSDSSEVLKAICESDGSVAFFGTPCQVAGVNSLLLQKGVREKAVLIEIICHGVPSQLLWERYLKDLNQKWKTGEHPSVLFRDKQIGWGPRKQITVKNKENVVYSSFDDKDIFYTFFNNSLFNSRCCYECPFRERSCADVRIGDYWGPRFRSDQEGVSMVIVLTRSGTALLNKCSDLGAIQRYSINEYWSTQYPFNFGIPLFWEDIALDLRNARKPLKKTLWKYARPFIQRDLLKKIKESISRGKSEN